MRRTWPLFTVVCVLPTLAALVAVAQPAPMPPPAPSADDESLLKAAKFGVDGPGLLDYFHRHTTPPEKQEHILALIQQLGDDSFKVRNKATTELAALGAAAIPYVRRAQDDANPEVQERVDALMKGADGSNVRADQSAAAARLIRQRAPADAAAALLAYLPDADSDAVDEEVLASLAVLGVHDGKVDAPIVAALKDKAAARRAGAAVVFGRSGTTEQRADVGALLLDPDPRVRFRAAQGLLAGHDRAGIPALVALIKDGPADLAYRSDELLSCAVGFHSPHIPYDEDAATRQNCHKAWAAWAQKSAKTIDLSHADSDLPAFNTVMRARDVVRQCFNSLVSGDLAAFKKAADAPFHMANEPPYKTRDDLDRYFNNNPLGIRNGACYASIMGTVPLREYTKGASATPDDASFAATFKAGDLGVFLVQQANIGAPNPNPDPTQGILFLVRLTGDQPRVIGISPGRSQLKFVW
jgi:hypothetical protein